MGTTERRKDSGGRVLLRASSTLAAVSLLVCGAVSDPARATTITFSATIDGAQETPPNGSASTGTGTFVMDTVANTLSFNITFTPLVSGELFSHIHGPAPAGVPAGILFPLPNGSPKIGVWNFTEAQQADIIAGLTYVNIHSNAIPAGEIRGQILPDLPLPADHYQCYKGKDLKNPPFVQLKAKDNNGVQLDDQFGGFEADVKKLRKVCTPVDKNGEGIFNPALHYCEYLIKGAKFDPKPVVEVSSQFQVSQFEVKKAFTILVPCDKTVLP
jgi:hypothetical protein